MNIKSLKFGDALFDIENVEERHENGAFLVFIVLKGIYELGDLIAAVKNFKGTTFQIIGTDNQTVITSYEDAAVIRLVRLGTQLNPFLPQVLLSSAPGKVIQIK